MSNDSPASLAVHAPVASEEELFTQYPILHIQKLSVSYRNDAERAKNDLFELVGHKYRDLVEIAEDIRTMYEESIRVSEGLSEQAYRKLTFIDFTSTNLYGRFDSEVRRANAQRARANGKTTILKNLIYDRLVSIDLGLAAHSEKKDASVPIDTYINNSKIYFTIETIFGDILHLDTHLKEKFDSLKSAFRVHLETLIAEHNSWVGVPSSVVLHDLVRLSGMSLETSLDDLSELLIEPVDSEDPQLHSAKEFAPLVGILCAYVILNLNDPELDTITKVFERFAELRATYVESLMRALVLTPRPSEELDFLRLFLYIENTCNYIKSYFDSPTLKGNLASAIRQNTQHWSAADVIGFRNWFEIDVIHFNHQLYDIRIPESSLEAVNDIVVGSVKLVSEMCKSLLRQAAASANSELARILVAQKLCHNFFIDLTNLGRVCYGQLGKCNMIRLFQDQGLLSAMLEHVVSTISVAYTEHLDKMMPEADSKSGLSATLATIPNKKNETALFSLSLFEVLDNSVESYLETMHGIANSAFFISNSSAQGSALVEEWFAKVSELHTILGLTTTKDKRFEGSRYNLLDLVEQLEEFEEAKPYLDVAEKSVSRLKDDVLQKLWSRLELFVNHIVHSKQSDGELELGYNFLRILLTLSDCVRSMQTLLPAVSDEYDASVITEKLETSCRESINGIFRACMKSSRATSFNNLFNAYLKDESTSSTRFIALLYELCSVFFTSELATREYEDIQLFQSSVVKEEFITLKRTLLAGDLTEKLLSLLKASTSISEEPKDESQTLTANTLRVLKDILLLLYFAHEENSLGSRIAQAGVQLPEESVEQVSKAAADFYASSKHIFLPLLI